MENQSRELSVILPNNKELSLTVGIKDRGQDVFNQLSEILDISGLHLFGLSVIKDNQPLFLDLEKKLSLYLPKSWRKNRAKEKVTLSLKLQYFVGNAQLIGNSECRQLYYAEVKERVLRSECFEQEGLYFQLAAYALQADLGDYEERNFEYFSPLVFFPFWEKRKAQGGVLLGLTSTGLQISEGRKFDIRAEGFHKKSLLLFTCSVLHAKHLLQHISNSHRMHLNTKRLTARLKEKGGRHREMYIIDGAELDMEDSDDKLPPVKFLLHKKSFTGTTDCENYKGDECSLEMSVDEPGEMFVDEPEDVLRLIEMLEGVSVDAPLLLPISHWKGDFSFFNMNYS